MPEEQHATFEQWVDHVSETLLRQDFMLRSLTTEVERLRALVPDAQADQVIEGPPGQTRGTSTAFRLPDGWGSFVLTVKADGSGILKYQNGPHTEKVEINLVRT